MRKAGLKKELEYIKGYKCGLDYCLYLIGKDYQPTVIIDYLQHEINKLNKDICKRQKEIYGWSEE